MYYVYDPYFRIRICSNPDTCMILLFFVVLFLEGVAVELLDILKGVACRGGFTGLLVGLKGGRLCRRIFRLPFSSGFVPWLRYDDYLYLPKIV